MGRSGGDWEQLFWLVFERSSNPIFLVAEERRIVEINPAVTALLGQTRDELVGRWADDSIRPDQRPAARADWDRFLRTGQGYGGTRALVRDDGSTVTVDFAAQFAHIDDRRLAIFVSMPVVEAQGAAATGVPLEGSLSEREREVVTLIALGNETPEIARELHIAPATVRTHVRNAMAKLGVHTRAQLVAVALCGDGFLARERVAEAAAERARAVHTRH
jgi:PAS domain S-box-containing protein